MAVVPKEEPRDGVLPQVPKQPAPDAKARAAALKSITDNRRVTAWQLHRWPLEKRIVNERTRIHLPRTYLSKDGSDVRAVYAGTDLNQFVHQHYLEEVQKNAGEGWANYVTAESVVSRRHEYLGPDPRVAGYFFDSDGEVHIKWWDAFLQDQWMDKQKWKFDVKLDEDGKWVEIDD
ncbi:hypothetical protein A0H81_02139 [Grifola frondosa]|uniref:Uncharacterized protein n=1 Tax=Grifola frondosa TaxID=5627 RepID=A0A1C7MSI6_GRIFR|nr:hypothetical protein A0H81_02139 [Grifola frondosa]